MKKIMRELKSLLESKIRKVESVYVVSNGKVKLEPKSSLGIGAGRRIIQRDIMNFPRGWQMKIGKEMT